MLAHMRKHFAGGLLGTRRSQTTVLHFASQLASVSFLRTSIPLQSRTSPLPRPSFLLPPRATPALEFGSHKLNADSGLRLPRSSRREGQLPALGRQGYAAARASHALRERQHLHFLMRNQVPGASLTIRRMVCLREVGEKEASDESARQMPTRGVRLAHRYRCIHITG